VDERTEPVYKIRMASSLDGIHWAKLNRDLIESRIEEDEAQASPMFPIATGNTICFFAIDTAATIGQRKRIPNWLCVKR